MNLAKFTFRTEYGNLVDVQVSKDHQILIFVDGKSAMVLSWSDSKVLYETLRTARELIHHDVQK